MKAIKNGGVRHDVDLFKLSRQIRNDILLRMMWHLHIRFGVARRRLLRDNTRTLGSDHVYYVFEEVNYAVSM